jgi:hypothetical protein
MGPWEDYQNTTATEEPPKPWETYAPTLEPQVVTPEQPSTTQNIIRGAGEIMGAAQAATQTALNPASFLTDKLVPESINRFMRTGLVSPQTIQPITDALMLPARGLSEMLFGKEASHEPLETTGKAVSELVSGQTSPENLFAILGTAGIGAAEGALGKRAPNLGEMLFGREARPQIPETPITDVAEVKPKTGGEINAIEPSNAQVQTGETPLRVEEGAGSEIPRPSDSDNVVRETQGTAEPGEIPARKGIEAGQEVAPLVSRKEVGESDMGFRARLQQEVLDRGTLPTANEIAAALNPENPKSIETIDTAKQLREAYRSALPKQPQEVAVLQPEQPPKVTSEIRGQEMSTGDDVQWMSGGTWDGKIQDIVKKPSGTHDVTVKATNGETFTLKDAEHYGINLGRSEHITDANKPSYEGWEKDYPDLAVPVPEAEAATTAAPEKTVWYHSGTGEGSPVYLTRSKEWADSWGKSQGTGAPTKAFQVTGKIRELQPGERDELVWNSPYSDTFRQKLLKEGYVGISDPLASPNAQLAIIDPSALKEIKEPTPVSLPTETTTAQPLTATEAVVTPPTPVEVAPPLEPIRPAYVQPLTADSTPAEVGPNVKGFETVYGPGEIKPGESITPEEIFRKGKADLAAGKDPYVIADRARTGDVSHKEIGLLAAEHDRLLTEAAAAEGTPSYEAKYQVAKDFAQNMLKPAGTKWHQTGMGLQVKAPVDLSNLTGFRAAFEERFGKEMSPEQSQTFSKMAKDLSEAKVADRAELGRTAERVKQRFKGVKDIPFEDAVKSMHELIKTSLKDCNL